MKFKITLLFFLSCYCSILYAQKTATLIYIDQYKDIAIREMKRTGIPASITLAQGIVESNSGESNLALNFNNHFGIKCKSDWKGQTTYQDDDAKQECFRVYPNANASFIDHSNFIKSRPNYAPLFQLDPVDDSAWAIGLKKAGYATAADYPKKLMKVIDDYELSQYNFPELNDENDTAASETEVVIAKPVVANSPAKNSYFEKMDSTTSIANKKNDVTISARKDTTLHLTTTNYDTVKTTNSSTITINNIKGIEHGFSNVNVTTIRMNSIGMDTTLSTKNFTNKTATTALTDKDSSNKGYVKNEIVSKSDTSYNNQKTKGLFVKDTAANKSAHHYPETPFKINQIPVFWAKAGTSFLQIATENNIPLYKIFLFNDLKEADLLDQDQLLFLANKKAEGDKSFHLVTNGETLYEISQKEGIQLKKLKEYNPTITSSMPATGTQLLLVKPKEQKLKVAIKK